MFDMFKSNFDNVGRYKYILLLVYVLLFETYGRLTNPIDRLSFFNDYKEANRISLGRGL